MFCTALIFGDKIRNNLTHKIFEQNEIFFKCVKYNFMSHEKHVISLFNFNTTRLMSVSFVNYLSCLAVNHGHPKKHVIKNTNIFL